MARIKKDINFALNEKLEQALVPVGEQPYEVPENWVWTRGIGLFLPMETKRPTGESFLYIDIDSIDNKTQKVIAPKEIDTKIAPSRASRALKKGDTVFSMVRPYLKNIAYIDISLAECIASTGFYVCHPSAIVNDRYLFLLMTSGYVVDGLNSFMKGDNSPSIRKENIERFAYPIPPFVEQQRIVERVESLFAKLDAAKELVQSVLDSFETSKAAILHKAFTGELTAKWREEHGVGMEDWTTKCIGEIGEVKGGKRLPKGVSLINENTGCPYIKAGDLKGGTVNTSRIQYITAEMHKKLQRYTVTKGDIYITIVGACIGDVGVVPDSVNGANLTENAARITDLRCDSSYLGMCMASSIVQFQIKERIASATLGKLSLQNIKAITVPITSLKEQKEIVRILDSLFEKEQQAREFTDILEQIDLMKKAILGQAFRGELGTNDPTEESAVELLKEVLSKM